MGRYLGRLYETWQISGVLGYLLVVIWLLYPVAIATILHPTDAVGFQAWLQGMDIPRYVSRRAVDAGFLEALLALAVLFLFHLVIVTLIYRLYSDHGSLLAACAHSGGRYRERHLVAREGIF